MAMSAQAQRAPNMPLIWWPYSCCICTLGLVASQQVYSPCAVPAVPEYSALGFMSAMELLSTLQESALQSLRGARVCYNVHMLCLQTLRGSWDPRPLAVEAAAAGDVEGGHHAIADRDILHARAHRLHRAHELRGRQSASSLHGSTAHTCNDNALHPDIKRKTE